MEYPTQEPDNTPDTHVNNPLNRFKHEGGRIQFVSLDRELAAISLKGIDVDQGKEVLPPIESIPSLFTLGIKGPDSMHEHKYDTSNTVWTKLSVAEDTPKSERTHQQVELMDDVKRLEAYAPYTSGYMDVFTPSELHALVGKLDLLRQKNRPDFNAVEGKIIDAVIRNQD